MPPSPDMPEALSIWHFLIKAAVWFAFFSYLFAAVTGILGMNAVNTEHKKWPVWVWGLFTSGLILSVLAALQSAFQLQDAELDERIANSQYLAVKGQLGEVQDQQKKTMEQLDSQTTKLGTLGEQDTKMQNALNDLRTAAHIAPGTSLDDLVRGISSKLPKSPVTIKGNGNVTAVGGGQAAQQQTVNAPNGIGTIGGTLVNPQVNNFGPPPAHLTYTENVLTPLKDHTKRMLEVHVKTDRAIPAATIGITFSEPITFTKEYFEVHSPELKPTSLEQMDIVGPLQRFGVIVPNSLGVVINAPAAFSPGQELIVTVESDKDVHVIEVMQFTRQ